MPADILQIRDFQRPKERLACDQRLGYGMPTICITEDGVETLAKYSAMRDELQAIADIPADYDPRRPA